VAATPNSPATLPIHTARKVQSLAAQAKDIKERFDSGDSITTHRMTDVYPTFYHDHSLLQKILKHNTISEDEEQKELPRIQAALSDAKDALNDHDEEEQHGAK